MPKNELLTEELYLEMHDQFLYTCASRVEVSKVGTRADITAFGASCGESHSADRKALATVSDYVATLGSYNHFSIRSDAGAPDSFQELPCEGRYLGKPMDGACAF